jgi:hypothetical protein
MMLFTGFYISKITQKWCVAIVFIVFAYNTFVSDSFAAQGKWELSSHASKYLDDDDLPPRAKPLIELGPKFLATGNISKGFTLPTGAVWTPSLWVYGTFSSAYQTYDDDTASDHKVEEWANRLDLFANLQLSGTERLLIGLTPLHDRDTGVFSGKVFSSFDRHETVNELNLDLDTFFFEGDLAEIFPKWDIGDGKKNDIGFSIGRQNVLFGEGFLVNDNMDGFGLSKNNIRFSGNPNIINWRSSIFIGLNHVNRANNIEDEDSKFYGWFNQIDGIRNTYNIDLAYVDGEEAGDLFTLGIDATRRFGKTNATFRAALSQAAGMATPQSDDGLLLFSELSWVPKFTHDNLYLNGFLAIDNFTSAARGPLEGGPLGRTGLLFAAQGLGSFPAPLSNVSRDASGIALGYQRFSNDKRTQLTIEAGARFEGGELNQLEDEYGLGLRFQKALGYRSFWQVDAFATKKNKGSSNFGIRLEFQIEL